MTRLTLPAPAKLNLFLHITGQREDGYHNLQTVFQLLDHGDVLHFQTRSDSEIHLQSGLIDVPVTQNLVWKAAKLLQTATQCPQGADIILEKRLPKGGGIGGGSSDAATTLLALNHLWGTHLSLTNLADIGRQLGADVPVFVYGKSAWAEGIGERLTPLSLPPRYFLVAAPETEISTAEIFSHKDLTRDTADITVAAFLEQGGKNDCEPLVRSLYPEVKSALNWLGQFGPAQLTGTGACSFVAFNNQADANSAMANMPSAMKGFIARGIDASPVHAELSRLKPTGV